jgi:hypothetical protein
MPRRAMPYMEVFTALSEDHDTTAYTYLYARLGASHFSASTMEIPFRFA